MKNLRIPLLNAGNGSGEHPTQALADWFAILKWKPELKKKQARKRDRIHLGILGTPGSMRAVKSFLQMSLLFSSHIRRISIVSRSEEHTSELQSLMRISYAVFCLKKQINTTIKQAR